MTLSEWLPPELHEGLPRYLKNTGWVLWERVLRLGGSVMVTILVARVYGPDAFGLLSLVLALIGLIMVFTEWGMPQLVRRELLACPEEKGAVLGTFAGVSLLTGVVGYVLLLAIVFLMRPGDPTSLSLAAWLGALLLLVPMKGLELFFHARVRGDLVAKAAMPGVLMGTVGKVLVVVFGGDLETFAMIVLLEAVLIAGLQGILYLFNQGSFRDWRWESRWARRFLMTAWPMMLSGLAAAAYMKIDHVMLGILNGEAAVGIYAAAVRISSIWHMLPMVLATSLFPAIMRARRQSPTIYAQRLQQYYDLNAQTAYFIILPLWLFSSSLVVWLFGEAYTSAGPVLAVHAWSCLFVFLGVSRGQYLVAEALYLYSMYTTGMGAVLNIGLNLWLIPVYGPLGAAWATLAAQAFAAVLSCFIFSRLRGTGWMLLRAMVPGWPLLKLYYGRRPRGSC